MPTGGRVHKGLSIISMGRDVGNTTDKNKILSWLQKIDVKYLAKKRKKMFDKTNNEIKKMAGEKKKEKKKRAEKGRNAPQNAAALL